MNTTQNTIPHLLKYIQENEVVYQFSNELINVSNNNEQENKEKLLESFYRANHVDIYTKYDTIVKNRWTDLTNWSTAEDILFLLDGIDVLLCIPKNKAIENNLIEI